LIELVLVIAIVAVIAAMAAPRYTDALARYRIDSTSRRIADDFALAQSRARSTSSSRTIVFNAASSSYQLIGERDLNVSGNTYSVNLAADPYYASVNKLNFGLNGGPSVNTMTITFNGYGVPNTAGTVQIKCGAYTRKIMIDGDTGAPIVK